MQWASPISSDDVITMQKPISTTTTSRSIKGHKVCVMRIDGVLTSMGVLVARILARDEGADSLCMLQNRWKAVREATQKAVIEADAPELEALIRESQLKDIRSKAATEINDLKEASRLLGHTEEEITKTVYVRRGAIAKPSK